MIEDRRTSDKVFIARFEKIDARLEKIDAHIAAEKKEAANLARLVESRHDQLQRNLKGVDDHMLKDLEEHASMRAAMQLNTELTESVKRDTAAIVKFWGGAATFKKFLAWAVPVVASAIAAWVTWHVKS